MKDTFAALARSLDHDGLGRTAAAIDSAVHKPFLDECGVSVLSSWLTRLFYLLVTGISVCSISSAESQR